MGEIVRFVPRSELERARLIREARAIYDSIFPPAIPRVRASCPARPPSWRHRRPGRRRPDLRVGRAEQAKWWRCGRHRQDREAVTSATVSAGRGVVPGSGRGPPGGRAHHRVHP